MRINITDIYRIETMNSTYEIKVVEEDGKVGSLCKKMGKREDKKQVKSDDLSYLDELTIGASFDVPGVVLTSVVQDYQHYVLSDEKKRIVGSVQDEFQSLADAIVGQIKEQIRV